MFWFTCHCLCTLNSTIHSQDQEVSANLGEPKGLQKHYYYHYYYLTFLPSGTQGSLQIKINARTMNWFVLANSVPQSLFAKAVDAFGKNWNGAREWQWMETITTRNGGSRWVLSLRNSSYGGYRGKAKRAQQHGFQSSPYQKLTLLIWAPFRFCSRMAKLHSTCKRARVLIFEGIIAFITGRWSSQMPNSMPCQWFRECTKQVVAYLHYIKLWFFLIFQQLLDIQTHLPPSTECHWSHQARPFQGDIWEPRSWNSHAQLPWKKGQRN